MFTVTYVNITVKWGIYQWVRPVPENTSVYNAVVAALDELDRTPGVHHYWISNWHSRYDIKINDQIVLTQQEVAMLKATQIVEDDVYLLVPNELLKAQREADRAERAYYEQPWWKRKLQELKERWLKE